MKNIEKIMLRDAISQMLADNGIDRETLLKMVNDIVAEKVEKALARVLHDKEANIDQIAENVVRRSLEQQVISAVRRAVSATSISIEHRKVNLGGKEYE